MIVELAENISWDTELEFVKQSEECQNYIKSYKEDWSKIIDEVFENTTNSRRVIVQVFELVETHDLKVNIIYKYPTDHSECGIVDRNEFNLIKKE